jgi:hypothetical protein
MGQTVALERKMTNSDVIGIWNIVATVIAVLAAPVIALWIGGILQARIDTRKQQLQLLGVLLSLRHQPLSPENFKALNSIDAVFADSAKVRDTWTKYFAALVDQNLNNDPGFAVREEKRRDVMTAIVECLGLQKKITTADLLRAYTPNVMIEIEHLAMWERIKRRTDLRAEFLEKGIGFPDYNPPCYPVQTRPATPPERAAGQGVDGSRIETP